MVDTQAAEDKIRDIINLIAVYNEEELEGGTKKIEDAVAAELKEKLQELAQTIGSPEE